MQLISYKNGGLNENWGALYLCICSDYSSDKALSRMGIRRMNHIKKTERKPKKQKEIDGSLIAKMYKEGYTINELAEQFQVDIYRIKGSVLENGGTIRKRGQSLKKKMKEGYEYE